MIPVGDLFALRVAIGADEKRTLRVDLNVDVHRFAIHSRVVLEHSGIGALPNQRSRNHRCRGAIEIVHGRRPDRIERIGTMPAGLGGLGVHVFAHHGGIEIEPWARSCQGRGGVTRRPRRSQRCPSLRCSPITCALELAIKSDVVSNRYEKSTPVIATAVLKVERDALPAVERHEHRRLLDTRNFVADAESKDDLATDDLCWFGASSR